MSSVGRSRAFHQGCNSFFLFAGAYAFRWLIVQYAAYQNAATPDHWTQPKRDWSKVFYIGLSIPTLIVFFLYLLEMASWAKTISDSDAAAKLKE